MQKISDFLKMSSISKINWVKLVAVQTKFESFLGNLDEANQLYDNPGKITRPRLFACASSLYPAYEPLAVFGVANRLATVPKMIALIYKIEKEKGSLSTIAKTTRTSEHLVHLLLTLGAQYPYVYNRNGISKSVRDVHFNLN